VEQQQETLTLNFMEEGRGEKVGEEDKATGPYEDAVFYFTEGLCYTENGQPIYIAQQEEGVVPPQQQGGQETEVQSAILSIVETGHDVVQ